MCSSFRVLFIVVVTCGFSVCFKIQLVDKLLGLVCIQEILHLLICNQSIYLYF